jgi:hypothetical protein
MGGAVTMLPGAICVGGCYVVMNRFDAGEYLRLMRLAGATADRRRSDHAAGAARASRLAAEVGRLRGGRVPAAHRCRSRWSNGLMREFDARC